MVFFVCWNIWVFNFLSFEFSLLFSIFPNLLFSCRDVSSLLPVCHSMFLQPAMSLSLLCSLAPSLICLSSCVNLMCQSTFQYFLFYFDSRVVNASVFVFASPVASGSFVSAVFPMCFHFPHCPSVFLNPLSSFVHCQVFCASLHVCFL